MRASLLATSVMTSMLLACGGRVDGVPSPGSTTSPPASSTDPTPGSGSSSGGLTGSAPASDPPESCDIACDEGHHVVQGTVACAPDGACYTRASCGATYVCDGPKGLCDEPACLGYTIEVKTCAPGATCETQLLCDRTLLCKKTDAQCDGMAACDDESDEQVASATECAKLASRCYSRASCGSRIYCVRAL